MNIKCFKRIRKIKKWLKWTPPRIKSAYEDMRRNAFYITNYLVYLDWRDYFNLRFWIINFLIIFFFLIIF